MQVKDSNEARRTFPVSPDVRRASLETLLKPTRALLAALPATAGRLRGGRASRGRRVRRTGVRTRGGTGVRGTRVRRAGRRTGLIGLLLRLAGRQRGEAREDEAQGDLLHDREAPVGSQDVTRDRWGVPKDACSQKTSAGGGAFARPARSRT